MHDDLVFGCCSQVKSQVSINHSSDLILNCCLKLTFLTNFLLQNVGRYLLKEKLFFSLLCYVYVSKHVDGKSSC